MKKMLIAILIVVVLVFSGTYVVYALDYKGNYNVTVRFLAQTEDATEFSVSGFSVSSEPTDMVDCWDLLKGAGGPNPDNLPPLDTIYYVYVEAKRAGVIEGGVIAFFNVSADSSAEFGTVLKNLEPGEYDFRVYVKYDLTDQIVYDYTFTDRTVGA